MNLGKLAETIDKAAENSEAVPQLSLADKFNEKDAYKIQKLSIKRRIDRGEKQVGIKMGFTSKAKMEQMGVHDMIWGKLTDKMLINRGNSINIKKYIHPRAEPEVCFLVKKKIDKEIKTIEEAKEYIAGYAVAIEIIDSRYKDFKFSLEDVIADNCSSAGLVIGTWQPIEDPINNLKVTLEVDGQKVQEGNTSAILGDPWEALFNATRLSIAAGENIPFGAYVMAGAATSAVYIKPGQTIKASIDTMGDVDFNVLPLN